MKQTVLFGSYTHKTSQGIYRATFDSATDGITSPTPYITSLESPTYLAVSKANILYGVDAKNGQGGIAAVDLNQTPPRLINRVLAPGTAPAHVAIDEKRQLVFASNYHESRVNVYRIDNDHGLAAAAELHHSGSGPRPEQETSHIHYAALAPDDRLAVVDLGNDTLTTYAVASTGQLSDEKLLHLPAGYGPRHLVFNPTAPFAYLVGELSSQVSVLSYQAGTFSLRHTYATVPNDWQAHNGAAAIRLTKDGKFLYVSNRGHDSIAAFAVQADGASLAQIQVISTAGQFPRDFNFDLTEHYLLAVNQNSDNGTLYQRDPTSGLLTPQVQDIPTPEAVNVVFLPARV